MRITSIFTAAFVCVAIYFLIIERDALYEFAGVEPAGAQTTETEADEIVAQEPSETVSVVVVRSQAQDVTNGIILRGETNAFRILDVRAETNGTVLSQPLRKGTLVEEGELLCELDPGTKGATLAEAKARLASAEVESQASENLVQKGFASETQAISRRAALESAQAAVQRAQDDLDNLKITAPFTGLLETDSAEFGALLQPGSPCATVIELNPIKLVGFATELQVARIEVGALAGARLITGEEVGGRVSFISRSADQVTRTFRVEITVPNDDLAIRDGSTADIFISLAGTKGHLLPQSALTLNKDGQIGVRVNDNGNAGFVPLEIIRDTAEGIWVTGLGDSAEVIVLGQEYVVTGTPLSITYRDDAS